MEKMKKEIKVFIIGVLVLLAFLSGFLIGKGDEFSKGYQSTINNTFALIENGSMGNYSIQHIGVIYNNTIFFDSFIGNDKLTSDFEYLVKAEDINSIEAFQISYKSSGVCQLQTANMTCVKECKDVNLNCSCFRNYQINGTSKLKGVF